ncbi:protein Dok-7-like isoform X5 [Salvelinus fontinalis]|uniref:protein Dok-7-like isoform X5 n=1 Tax=Salvelinus fontinalis TaxID=8038 RepID=UPI0024850B4D|nr:protein Dok-7-like isoform X5 [Salvelinus fontinalis]
MTDSVVVEGYVKFRDGKKWKTRWVVLRKPSPVADCLVLLVYKDKSDKAQGHREKGSITLEDICGLETGLSYEGVNYTLAILCLSQVAVLGFDGKEALLAWDIRIRYSLGEVHRFSVGILPGTKLESGSAILHLCNNLLVLARDIPPVIIGQWNLPDLRRYGPVPNGFVFEGGTRCGYWAGVFFLSSMEGEQISFLFDCIVRGISPTRGPFGLRPILPDPNAAANQAYSEERVNHEAQELEKRLSMLSHQSSTAFAYGLSEAGDDRSISGSSDTSDTSQSDSSIGSRLAIWTEPVTTSSAPTDTIIGHSGSKVALQAEDKLSVIQVCGAHAVAKPPRSRQLQEIGRQSSSDSGIATGSHSSYSGSFSSYAGSLDIGSGGDDFGSLLSLPTHLDLAPCTCPPAPGKEYQVPTSLRYLYDTPRNLLQGGTGGARGHQTSTTSKDQAGSSPQSPPSCKSVQREKEGPLGGRSDTVARRSTADLLQGHSEESKSRVAPSSDSQHPDSYQICSSSQATASKTLLIICATCGGFKGTPVSYTAGSAMPAVPDKKQKSKEERHKVEYEIMESRALEKSSEPEEKSKYELMGSCGQQRLLHETEAAMFVFPPEMAAPERPRGDGVTYVNIPISPTSKKQLNYMELEHQEQTGVRGTGQHLPGQNCLFFLSTGKSSTKYAQIDITATDAAHKTGTQHALGREEGLHTLEQRRRGVPQ